MKCKWKPYSLFFSVKNYLSRFIFSQIVPMNTVIFSGFNNALTNKIVGLFKFDYLTSKEHITCEMT